MLDLSHIPDSQQDIKIFNAVSGSNSWQTWQKPRKCQWVWVMAIGGAGGGAGGGNIGSVYSTGGASGAVTRALFNASHLPDTLYAQVGLGGAGGGVGTAGSAGTRTYVSIRPTTSATDVIISSGLAAAAGGTSGTGTSAAGETAFTSGNGAFVSLATFISTAGTTATGTAVQQAPNITPLTSQITCPGGGGPGLPNPATVSYNGASILSSSIGPLIQGGALASASGSSGGRGADGITSWKPFYSLGGAGGGSSISGSGGNGGNGGIGSGGGGGGAVVASLGNTAGSGGRGGDGLVVIISF